MTRAVVVLLLALALARAGIVAGFVGNVGSSFRGGSPRLACASSFDRVEVKLEKPMGLQLEEAGGGASGVLVGGVVPNSNAAKAGVIEAGMVILEIEGQDATAKDFDEVMEAFVKCDSVASLVLGKRKAPLEATLTIVDGQKGSAIVCKTGGILRDTILANGGQLYDLWGTAMNCGGAGQW